MYKVPAPIAPKGCRRIVERAFQGHRGHRGHRGNSLGEAADHRRPRRGSNARVPFGRELHHDASRAESTLGYEAASPSSPVKTSVCCFKHCYCISGSDGSVGCCGLPGQQVDHQLALYLLEAHYLVHRRGMRLCQLQHCSCRRRTAASTCSNSALRE